MARLEWRTWGGAEIRDDVQRAHPFRGLSVLNVPDDGRAAIARSLKQELTRAVKTLSRRSESSLVAIGFLVGFMLARPMWMVAAGMGIPGGFGLLIIVAGLFALTWWARRRGMWAHAQAIACSIVARGLCGSCAYRLTGLEQDSRAMVLCPECGARWEARRITGAGVLIPPRSVGAVLRATPLKLGQDANGVLFRRLDSSLWGIDKARRREMGRERVHHLWRRLRRLGRRRRHVGAVIMVATGVLLAFTGWLVLDSDLAIFTWFVAAICVIGAVVRLLSEVGMRTEDFVQVCVSEGICAHCGGDAQGVCRGCGTVWY